MILEARLVSVLSFGRRAVSSVILGLCLGRGKEGWRGGCLLELGDVPAELHIGAPRSGFQAGLGHFEGALLGHDSSFQQHDIVLGLEYFLEGLQRRRNDGTAIEKQRHTHTYTPLSTY